MKVAVMLWHQSQFDFFRKKPFNMTNTESIYRSILMKISTLPPTIWNRLMLTCSTYCRSLQEEARKQKKYIGTGRRMELYERVVIR